MSALPPPTAPEPWLRGPVPDVPPTLQPAAHALQQALEDVRAAVGSLDDAALWASPGGGAASAGWHVVHAGGALDRLLTYARGQALDDAQRAALAAEQAPDPVDGAALLARFEAHVAAALAQLRATPETTLADARRVGRAQLPSTVLGLLFHAAEHTQRHVGALVTTARVVRGGRPG
ncbi:MAG: DinB family protein [Gemmatirosa sp.]